MALETLKDFEKVAGSEFKIIHMDDLKEKFPDKFNKDSGQMDYQWFESEIRPNHFIYVRHDKNSLSFTIQNGPIGEVGVNGCQVTDVIAVAKHIIEELNKKFPCRENAVTLTKLDEALLWQKKRTWDREQRGVEGTSQA